MAASLVSLLATGFLVICGLLSSWSSEDGQRDDSNTASSLLPDSMIPSSPKKYKYRQIPHYYMPYHLMPYYAMNYYYGYPMPTPKRPPKRGSNGPNRRQDYDFSMPRTFDHIDPYGGHAVDRTSDFYYVLPILLVIGLGSFLIPIISTFFTAMITSGGIGGCCGRKARGFRENPVLFDKLNSFWDSLEKSFVKFSKNFTITSSLDDLKFDR